MKLLLPPPLMLFNCNYLAAVQGKVIADNQHSIDTINPRFKTMRSGVEYIKKRSRDHFLTTNSSRADVPCPESADIAPCTCTVNSNRIYFDCTLAESVEQLVEVFKQDFPVKKLYRFNMENNNAINVFPSFTNGITFESVYLYPGLFILADISEQFLFDLKDTLKELVIYNSKLTTDFFPFSMLPSMNQLEYLHMSTSDINWIPPIRAPKLKSFYLMRSSLELLANGADSNELIRIDGYNSQLQSLRADTFPLRNGPMSVNFPYNQISSIEPGTFVLPASTDFLTINLYLVYNELTTVDEAVFGSMMPFITYMGLYGNPLICGCDMAWLILNEDFLACVDEDAT